MKKVIVAVLVAAAAAGNAFAGVAIKEVTGIEWMESPRTRDESLDRAMRLLRKNRVKLAQKKQAYYDGVYRLLRRDQEMQLQALPDVLAAYVYETEPGNREALDAFRAVKHDTRDVRNSWA